jgi:hypothetical protein
MIRDYYESFFTTAGVETLNEGTASGHSDYMDLGIAGAFDDEHRKRYLNIVGLADMTTGDGAVLNIYLVSDTAVGFATAKKTEWSKLAIVATDINGLVQKAVLPEGMYRYIRIEWTISVGTASGGGDFQAFLSNS